MLYIMIQENYFWKEGRYTGASLIFVKSNAMGDMGDSLEGSLLLMPHRKIFCVGGERVVNL